MEIEAIEKDVKNVVKNKKTRIFLFAGLGVIAVILIFRKKRGSSSSTASGGGYPSGAVVDQGFSTDVNALISDLESKMTDNNLAIKDYINETINLNREEFSHDVEKSTDLITNLSEQLRGEIANITQRTEIIYQTPETVTPLTPEIPKINTDLIGRLETDISRVSAKAGDPATEAWFSKNYGSLAGYLASQQKRLAQAKIGV